MSATLVLIDKDNNELRRVTCELTGRPKRLELEFDETILPELPTITVVTECAFRAWRRDHLQTGDSELVYEVLSERLKG